MALDECGSIALRDGDIRWTLHDWLQRLHVCSDTKILHELKMPRPSARIDLAVVNGELSGFEIKSDVDTLQRLPRQSKAFSTIFDSVTVVTTLRHLQIIEKAVPEWWGILTVSSVDLNQFESVRSGNHNPQLDSISLLHLLSRRELSAAFTDFPNKKRLPRDSVIMEIANNCDDEYIHDSVLAALKTRPPNISMVPHPRRNA